MTTTIERIATLIECSSDLCDVTFITLTPDRPHFCSQCQRYGSPSPVALRPVKVKKRKRRLRRRR
jgi:hypothetical protein